MACSMKSPWRKSSSDLDARAAATACSSSSAFSIFVGELERVEAGRLVDAQDHAAVLPLTLASPRIGCTPYSTLRHVADQHRPVADAS